MASSSSSAMAATAKRTVRPERRLDSAIRLVLFGGLEQISEPAHRAHVQAVRLKTTSQPVHRNLDRRVGQRLAGACQTTCDEILVHDAASAQSQKFKQRKLARGQVDRDAGQQDARLAHRELERAE